MGTEPIPFQHPLSYRPVERAKMQDIEHRQNINKSANKSIKRKQDQYKQNDIVLVKNFTRTEKFEPKYLPIPFRVISVNDTGVSIERLQTMPCFTTTKMTLNIVPLTPTQAPRYHHRLIHLTTQN